ncbi:MAG: hypothetical protein GY839_10535 [candidate division Zixibacteria bacterium]|nr:hypothetical protein [candidate division Zixibacteria bacterium]
MRKSLIFAVVIVMAFSMIFAYADDKKAAVSSNKPLTTSVTDGSVSTSSPSVQAALKAKEDQAEELRIKILEADTQEDVVMPATTGTNPNIALRAKAKEAQQKQAGESQIEVLSDFDQLKLEAIKLGIGVDELRKIRENKQVPSSEPGLILATGDDCTDPIVITVNDPAIDLPYATSDSTCGRGNTYSATCLGYYDGDEDIMYALTNNSASAITINIDVTSAAEDYLGILADTNCPPGDPCFAYATGGYDAFDLSLDQVTVNASETMYIMVDNWAEGCFTFDLTISEYAIPTGRCCDYTTPLSPVCTDGVEEASCTGAVYTWLEGTDCATDSCAVPAEGDNCYYPMVVNLPAAMPYADNGQTTQDRGLDKVFTTCGWYQDEDMVYELVVTSEVAVNIDIDPLGTTWTSVAVVSDCDGSGTCLDYSNNTSSTPHGIENLTLAAGTYYLWVDSYIGSGGDYIPSFNLTIEEYAIPTGRCCYYDEDPPDLANPLCSAPVTEADCAVLMDTIGGSWVVDLNCVDDPCPVPPANDDCANAMAVTAGTYTVNNSLATDDGVGTYSMYKNVWFCFTASVDGFATVDLCPVTWDTKMAAYLGCTCDPLGEEQAYNDDDNLAICDADFNQSAFEMSILAGQTYLIEAGNYSSSATGGDLVLTIAETECTPPANDLCVDAEAITGPYPATGSGTCFCASASCTAWNDVWYTIDLPYTYNDITITVCPTDADLGDAGLSLTPDCECSAYINANSWTFPDTNCVEGYDGVEMVFTMIQSGTGTLYWPAYVVDADDNGIPFNYTVNVTESAAPPEGDHCMDPIDITIPADLPYSDLSQYTCGRANYVDATCLDYYDGGEDIFYQLDVTTEIWLDVTLDPYTTTYTGIVIDDNCPADLADCIATSTNSGAGPHGFVELYLEAGTYYIMIDTWPTPDCIPTFDLTITGTTTPPTGACCYGDPITPSCIDGVSEPDCYDTYSGYSWIAGALCTDDPAPCPALQEGENCAYPKVIASLPYTDSDNTCNFADDCDVLYGDNADVIYEMVVTETTDWVTVSVCGAAWDTKIAIYQTDCCTGEGTEWAYNDDFCGLQSQIDTVFTPGTYYIVVDGYGTACGEYDLYVGTPPTGRCCYDDIFDPLCLSDLTEAECTDTYSGSWTIGLNCIDDPCEVCVVECPPEGIAEGETDCGTDYDDTYNGGCNSTIPVFQSISSGDIICGTSGTFLFDDPDNPGTYLNYRDTDWYTLDLTERKRVTWTATAEFPLSLIIITGNHCDSMVTVASGGADLCEELSLTAIVDPGTYYFFIAPSVYGDTPYNCPRAYVADVVVSDPPTVPVNDLCDNATSVAIPSSTVGYTFEATLDDAPMCVTTITAPGVWYSVTGNGNTLTASTCNALTGYDTKLNVYTGGCADPICVAGNDDNCTEFSLRSSVDWCSEIGVEYLVLVQGYNNYVGDFQLDIIDGDACEPPTGRCCYGDYYDYTCVDSVTASDCATTYSGVWTVDLNCTDNACPANPGFVVDPIELTGNVDEAGQVFNTTIDVSNIGTSELTFNASASITPLPAYTEGWVDINPINAKAPLPGTVNGRIADQPLITSTILAQGFEENLMPPTDWSTSITNAGFTWLIDSYSPYEGTYHADCVYDPALVPQDEYFISPVLDLTTAADVVTVEFYWNMSYYWGVDPYDNYDLELNISLDGGATWEVDPLWAEDNVGVFENWVYYLASVSLADYATETNVVLGWRYAGADGAAISVDAIRIHDDPLPWLSIDTESGAILPDSLPVTIAVTMDAADLDCGEYTGSIDFATNDPVYTSVAVPVTFTVCASGFEYLPGDVNMANGAWPPMVIGGDVTYLVNYFRGLPTSPSCLIPDYWCSADANGDCLVIGSDVTKLVTYFRGLASISNCVDYTPAWPTPDDLPAEAPAGWPNCVTPPVSSTDLPGGSAK